MTQVKTLGLAVVAAMLATAFIGAASASAHPDVLVLCKQPELECDESNLWPNPTTIVFHAVNPKILSSLGTVECEKSLLELTFLNELDTLILSHILSWVFEGNCHLGGTSCTVTASELGGISWTHGPNPLEWLGILVPLESRNTKLTVKCGFFINCTYTGNEEASLPTTSNASGESTIVANKAPMTKSSGICPKVSELDGTYVSLGTGYYLES